MNRMARFCNFNALKLCFKAKDNSLPSSGLIGMSAETVCTEFPIGGMYDTVVQSVTD